MALIFKRAKVVIRLGIIRHFCHGAHEQQGRIALCLVVDVTLPGGRIGGGCALRLPVEAFATDRIVFIKC